MRAHERRVLLPAPPDEVFAFLSDPANVPLIAPGVEDAVLVAGEKGYQGASLGLRTRRGRELRAQVTHFHEGEGWTVVDELGTVSQVQVEPEGAGTALTATLAGSWPPEREARVVAEWDAKIADLPGVFARPASAQRRM